MARATRLYMADTEAFHRRWSRRSSALATMRALVLRSPCARSTLLRAPARRPALTGVLGGGISVEDAVSHLDVVFA